MRINTNFNKIALSLAVLVACSNAVFADGNAFTPLNFDDTAYSAPKAAPKASTNPLSGAMAKVMPAKGAPADTSGMIDVAPGEVPIGNDNIQNAILELDNAQVGIRNDLLDYKAKYTDIDAQYKLIKNERSMLNKQVKSIEKRIRNIDRAKDKIRKNML